MKTKLTLEELKKEINEIDFDKINKNDAIKLRKKISKFNGEEIQDLINMLIHAYDILDNSKMNNNFFKIFENVKIQLYVLLMRLK